MNKIGKGIFSALLAAALFALPACNGVNDPSGNNPDPDDNYTPITDFSDGQIEKISQNTLYFNSPNAEWNDFLNDYFSRHVGYPTSNKVVNLDVGDGGTAWKEWETKSLMWHNSVQGLNSNRYQVIRDWLNSIPVDKFGYVWSSRDDSAASYNSNSYTSFDQGWPFPSMESMGDVRGYGWGSNLNVAPDKAGWATRCTGFETNGQYSVQGGGYRLTPDDDSRDELRLTLTGVQQGYTFYAPFVETRFSILENSGDVMGDLYLEWTTSDGQTHSVSYSEAGTQVKDFNSDSFNQSVRLYFWMPQVEGWGSSDNVYGDTAPAVTSMSLVFRPAEGKKLEGISFYIDYFRTDFDTRCIQNNAIYLDSIAEYYRYTGDDAYLEQVIDTCRRVFQFYLTYCSGEDGLVDQDNFVGHDGVPLAGHGISAGYFDIVSLPSEDFYFNVYYYKAIESMLYLERMAKAAGITGGEATVYDASLKAQESYSQTEQSLSALLEKTRSAIQTTFWSEEKGRFIEGFNDWSGELKRYTSGTSEANTKIAELASRGDEFDLGFLAFNLEAVAAGVATDEQAESILSWADGSRIIEGDDSTGADLYTFECAPRFNTINNDYWYYCGVATDENYPFTQQVQNGGSCLWISYYDLMARFKTLGMDSFSERLSEIMAWYSDVQDAYNEAVENGYTDSAKEFYRAYYYDLSACSSDKYDVFNQKYNAQGFVLQGQVNGKDSAGGLGLDAEFLENSVVYAAIPDAILGLSSQEYRTLTIQPTLPTGFEWFKLENLAFCYRKYDCCVGSNFVRITNVTKLMNRDDDLWLTVRFAKPDTAFRVYVDGQITEYVDEGETVSVTIPFRSTFVKIG